MAIVLLAVDWLARSLRWRLLFPGPQAPRFGSMFSATMAGYLFNNVLPARAGDVVRAHLLGRMAVLPRTRVFGTIVVERATDLAVLIVLLLIVVLARDVPSWVTYGARVLTALLIAVAFAIALFARFGDRLILMASGWLRFLPHRLSHRLSVAGSAFVEGLSSVKRLSQLGWFLLVTACIWSLEAGAATAYSYALGMPLTPVDALFVLLLVALGTMVPAAPGYIGTFEFFGLAALGMVGVHGSAAVAFVVLLHASVLLGTSAVGAACLAITGWPARSALTAKPGT